jgi:hypothetical protein
MSWRVKYTSESDGRSFADMCVMPLISCLKDDGRTASETRIANPAVAVTIDWDTEKEVKDIKVTQKGLAHKRNVHSLKAVATARRR